MNNENDKQPVSEKVKSFAIGVVILLILIGIDIRYLPVHYDQWQTQYWDKIDGNVEYIQITEYCSDGNCTYRLDIDYSYRYGREVYFSDQLSLTHWGGSDSSYGWKYEFLEDHPVDSQITVFVDPFSPDNSVIFAGFSQGSDVFFSILMLSIVHIILLIAMINFWSKIDIRNNGKRRNGVINRLGYKIPFMRVLNTKGEKNNVERNENANEVEDGWWNEEGNS